VLTVKRRSHPQRVESVSSAFVIIRKVDLCGTLQVHGFGASPVEGEHAAETSGALGDGSRRDGHGLRVPQ
jgi:hypothetical protein